MLYARFFYLLLLGVGVSLPALAQQVPARRPVKVRRTPPTIVGKLQPGISIYCPGFEIPPPPLPPSAPLGSLDNPYAYDEGGERMPEFPGGTSAAVAFLQQHLVYPEAARRAGVAGKVYVRFTVDSTGQVQRPTLLKGIGAGCDDEALRVVQLLPRFVPGRQGGRPVAVFVTVPVAFKQP